MARGTSLGSPLPAGEVFRAVPERAALAGLLAEVDVRREPARTGQAEMLLEHKLGPLQTRLRIHIISIVGACPPHGCRLLMGSGQDSSVSMR